MKYNFSLIKKYLDMVYVTYHIKYEDLVLFGITRLYQVINEITFSQTYIRFFLLGNLYSISQGTWTLALGRHKLSIVRNSNHI